MRLVIRGFAGLVVLVQIAFGSGLASAQSPADTPLNPAALKAELDALRTLIPSQSHAMADVDYHFANLWFAAKSSDWPLAQFYLNETRSHLNWAVRIRPVRRLSSGAELDLRPMLQAIEGSTLASVQTSLEQHDKTAFEASYRQMLSACFTCHQAAEKPYLRPHVPETPASAMIDFSPESSAP